MRKVILCCTAAALLFVNPGRVFASSNKKKIRITQNNAHLIENRTAGLVCLTKPKAGTKVPGKIRTKQVGKRSRTRLQQFFVSLERQYANSLQSMRKKKNRFSKKHIRLQKARFRRELRLARERCNRTAVWGDIRMRWFPVEQATSYVLTIRTMTGAVVRREELFTTGCTHQKLEGFTSGLCQTEIQTAGLPPLFNLEVSALNDTGESAGTGQTLL